jgi:hypothetical protein
MLEKDEITPTFFFGVVDLARTPSFQAGKSRAASKVQKDVQLLRRPIEVPVADIRRVRKTQRHLKKAFFVHSLILYFQFKTSKSHI